MGRLQSRLELAEAGFPKRNLPFGDPFGYLSG